MATSVVKSFIGANAANKAAGQQTGAAANATREQRRQYDLTRGDLLKQQEQTRADSLPFLQTGQAGNIELARLLGIGGDAATEGYGSLAKPFTMADYEADPGYAFRLSEGMKALDRVNASKGKYFSGQAIKGLTDYNQASASQEYQNAYDRYRNNQTDLYNRLTGVTDRGVNAAGGIANSGMQTQNTLAGAGQNKVNQINENTIGAGNAKAAGTIGSAQAWITGLNDVTNKAANLAGMFAGV
jgi:hypothetical protein